MFFFSRVSSMSGGSEIIWYTYCAPAFIFFLRGRSSKRNPFKEFRVSPQTVNHTPTLREMCASEIQSTLEHLLAGTAHADSRPWLSSTKYSSETGSLLLETFTSKTKFYQRLANVGITASITAGGYCKRSRRTFFSIPVDPPSFLCFFYSP